MTTQCTKANFVDRPVFDVPPVLTITAFAAMIVVEYDKRRPSARVSNDIAVNSTLKAIKAWEQMSAAEKTEFRAAARITGMLETTR
ncbi:hypothetical protein [Rhizobium ruizarguesonis]|uniref:hypothetical protein n=1 Tax=Rhizobium ruizarguesonis TaxID=2081791 RepID=UPI0010310442|nr:hypothetical protein [Rhizobium ruizarguesonis]TBD84801.1 hypothetical protein ELH13_08110 [Rhizobium ruizarguesonis]